MAERGPIDPEHVGEEYDRQHAERGGGGGKKHRVFGSEGRGKKKAVEAHEGMVKNRLHRREGGDKSPMSEVMSTMVYLAGKDKEEKEMETLKRYISFVKASIDDPRSLAVSEDDCSDWERLTPSVAAGGGGKDTSRNGRARTHVLTGIRTMADKRLEGGAATQNEEAVMEKMKQKLEKHVKNLRMVMGFKPGEVADPDKLEEQILTWVAGVNPVPATIR